MSLSRRALLGSIAGLGALLGLGRAAWVFLLSREERLIRRHLPDLPIPSSEVRTFVKAWRAAHGTPNLDSAGEISRYLEALVLSTDLLVKSNPRQAPRFVRLYDPYTAPCYSPVPRRKA